VKEGLGEILEVVGNKIPLYSPLKRGS